MSNTNADDKLIGFEYQFYYYFLTLLRMDKDDTVGFEVKEDVHTENSENLTLYQLKHTVKTGASGFPKNLTVSDKDVWKTLSLWVDIINLEADINVFLKNTDFVFVTNKSENEENEFLVKFNGFKDTGDFDELQTFLDDYNDNASATNKDYIANILAFSELELFFNQITFLLNCDDIIAQVKEELKFGKSIRESRIDNLFYALTGVLKENFYEKVKSEESFQFTGEEFYLKTVASFEKAGSERLPFQTLESYSKNTDIKDMIFAKQLLDIDFLDEKIYDSDYNRLLIETNLKKLYQDGEITEDDIERFEKNTIESWKAYSERIYIEDEDKTNANAKKLFLDMMTIDLDLAGQRLEWKEASKGQFVSLSNIPKIGWKHSWKSEYCDED